jgi:hypothetical protein
MQRFHMLCIFRYRIILSVSQGDVNDLLDDLLASPELQRQWELNPTEVAALYTLSEQELQALLDGNIDALVSGGLAERHVQQMRVSW